MAFVPSAFTPSGSTAQTARFNSRTRRVQYAENARKPVVCVASSSPPPPTPEKRTPPPPRFYTFLPEDVEAVRVRHVLVSSEELAGSVLETVRKKECTLGELATELSLCESTKAVGGDLGWWYVDEHPTAEMAEKLGMTPELMHAALRAEANKVALVRSDKGVHVFVVQDVRHRLRPTMRRRSRARSARKDLRVRHAPEPTVPMTYAIQTMGCQMNRADSERMAGELGRLGYREVPDARSAAVVVLNTCSIREHAEQKVYSYLGDHAARKRHTPGEVTLVVAGCVGQQEGETLLRRVPELDLVLGPQYSNRLGDLLEDVQTNQVQVAATEPVYIHEDVSKPRRESSVTAWVNVIYGCNERCTYCVVPNVRGLEQSRPVDAIVAELRELAKTSVREVVLLGQNVDAYGRDLAPRRTFSDLLEACAQVEGLDRIRFTTSHPRYMSERLVDVIAQHDKLMPAFHIPPQSGDDDVLRRMKRGYSVGSFERIVARIRERIPDAAIGGDLIAGFPGETEEEFENTLELMRRVRFDTLHTAAYSPRPNTPAAEMLDQVPEDVKMVRLRRLNQLVSEHALERGQRYLGRVEHVLVERAYQKGEGLVTGRNETNKVVIFPGDIALLLGKIVPVKIEDVTPFTIRGTICGDPY